MMIIAVAAKQDRQERLGDQHEAVAEEEAHGVQVDGRARHELPGLVVVEEAELERQEVLVEPVAQVVLDAERDLRPRRAAAARSARAARAPAAAISSASSFSWSPSCASTALIAAPVSAGIATVAPIASAASPPDSQTPRLYGRRNVRRRSKVDTGRHCSCLGNFLRGNSPPTCVRSRLGAMPPPPAGLCDTAATSAIDPQHARLVVLAVRTLARGRPLSEVPAPAGDALPGVRAREERRAARSSGAGRRRVTVRRLQSQSRRARRRLALRRMRWRASARGDLARGRRDAWQASGAARLCLRPRRGPARLRCGCASTIARTSPRGSGMPDARGSRNARSPSATTCEPLDARRADADRRQPRRRRRPSRRALRLGGYAATKAAERRRVQRYDPRTDRWTQLPAPTRAVAALTRSMPAADRRSPLGDRRRRRSMRRARYLARRHTRRAGTVLGPRCRARQLRRRRALRRRRGERWERVPAMRKARGGIAAATVNGRVVVVGGEEGAGTIAEVESYDPAGGAGAHETAADRRRATGWAPSHTARATTCSEAAGPWPGVFRPRRGAAHRGTNRSAAGRRPTRCTSPTTTRSGGGRCATTGCCSSACASRAFSRACRGSRSCASARAFARCSRLRVRRRSRASATTTCSGCWATRGSSATAARSRRRSPTRARRSRCTRPARR